MASELELIGTMTDMRGRAVAIGVRGDEVEITVRPHSGHDGRIVLAAQQQEEFGRLYIKACNRAEEHADQAVTVDA